MPQSDIQRLREQIALEIQAMHNGFQGIAIGIAKHQFIEARARNLGQLEDQLATHIGEEQAAAFTCQTYIQLTTESEGQATVHNAVLLATDNHLAAGLRAQKEEASPLVGSDEGRLVGAETLQEVPGNATRHDILTVLLHQLGDSEATQHLLAYIKELWETMDLLIERFGPEVARKIIDAPVWLPRKEVIGS